MTRSSFIGLEIHDRTLWEPARVLPMLPIMQAWGYNALVLHQNDLLDVCTQLGLTANYGVSDLRLKKVRNNAAWLNRLADDLSQFEAKLFLEIKEPSYEDYALELWPGLLGADGQPDPTLPIWADFCRAKVKDLLARAPDLGGLIVNLSSPESRVSMPDHAATHGGDLDKSGWFDRMIAAFAEPLADAGKTLYVRDFSYTADVQSDVLQAIERCAGAVQASIKITAHDYFPRAAENPGLRTAGPGAIAEVEAFGEHTGWGVIPNCRVAELCDRLEQAQGLNGILVRTSWEAISGANALDGLSAVNVHALPQIMRGARDAQALVGAWLRDVHGVEGPVADRAIALLLESWEIPAASYWNDQVFPRHSCLPSTWAEGWISMETTGMGRRDWSVTVSADDPRLTDEAGRTLFAKKEASTKLANQLAEAARELLPKLPIKLANDFAVFEGLPWFARQFELATKATFFAAKSDTAQATFYERELMKFADALEGWLNARKDLPHHHRVFFDPAQVRGFAASLTQT